MVGVLQLLRQLPDFTITLCGKPISPIPVAKDLGVFLDQCLTYDEHILKVQLTPKIIFPLTKSTSFPNYFSEKIISIDKIPVFLQAFKVVIFSPTTEQNGIWVGLLVTSSKELGSKNSRDFDWALSAVKT